MENKNILELLRELDINLLQNTGSNIITEIKMKKYGYMELIESLISHENELLYRNKDVPKSVNLNLMSGTIKVTCE